MELSDLRKSVSAQSDEELRALLMDIRQSRRVTKKAPTTTAKRKASASAGDSSASLNALIGNLTPEQITQMLATLEGGKK